jgi:hypothetical protein
LQRYDYNGQLDFILSEMVSWINSPRNAVTWISLDLTVMFFHTNNGSDKNVNKKNYSYGQYPPVQQPRMIRGDIGLPGTGKFG